MLLRLLPVLMANELFCCSKRLPILRQERAHVISILRSVYGLPAAEQKPQETKEQSKADPSRVSWQGSGTEQAEERATNAARAFLHKSRNIAGANRRTERERTTRARLTEARAREDAGKEVV